MDMSIKIKIFFCFVPPIKIRIHWESEKWKFTVLTEYRGKVKLQNSHYNDIAVFTFVASPSTVLKTHNNPDSPDTWPTWLGSSHQIIAKKQFYTNTR